MKMPDELPKKQEAQESEAKIEASAEQQVEAMGREIAADAANLSSELEADARKASSEEAKSELRGLAAEASQVAEDFSAEVAEAKGEQRESVRETYEYRDAEGKLVCKAEAEFESATEDDLRAAHLEGGRMLRSLVLKGEGGVEIDVLALAKAKDRKIFIPNQRQDNYHFSEETGQVMAPPLETPVDVGVLLHELGHADQAQEKPFKKIMELRQYNLNIDTLETLEKFQNDLELQIDPGEIAKLKTIMEDYQKLIKAKSEMQAERGRLSDKVFREFLPLTGMPERISGIRGEYQQKWKEMNDVFPRPQPEEFHKLTELYTAQLREAGFRPPTGDSGRKMPERFDTENSGALLLEYIPDGFLQPEMTQELDDSLDMEVTPEGLKLDYAFTFDKQYAGRKSYRLSFVVPLDKLGQEAAGRLTQAVNDRNLQDEMLKATEHSIGQLNQKFSGLRGVLDKVAAAPIQVVERDATRRAIRWMRQIKDKGVNLLAPLKLEGQKTLLVEAGRDVAPKSRLGVSGCTESVLEAIGQEQTGNYVETDVVSELQQALDSYSAMTKQMKQKYQGKIPRVKTKAKE